MSRKGSSSDNGTMGSFFGAIKTEMFYGNEEQSKLLAQLKIAIENYINHYNHQRIKVKLKGLNPVQYRIQSFN